MKNKRRKNISINYEIIGNGKPIVMLHGYHVDHRLMKGCMEPVFKNDDKYKRIYIDLPGMGKTRARNWIINSDIMLDIIIDFIEKIIPDTNFLLAGESYGGYLSRGIIYKIGNRVDGLLLICPVIIADFKKRNIPQHIVLERENEILPGLKLADNDFLYNIQQNGYDFSFDVDKTNKKFCKPVLILAGRQDSCVGYKDIWNILDEYPRATFAVLDRAGHNLQIEQPELFNSLVNE